LSGKKVEVEEKELDRLKAQNRGYVMSNCFNKKCFDLFVKAINDSKIKEQKTEPEASSSWDVACKAAGLTVKQRKWLWNYLKEYDRDLAWNQSSAINGW
jgi:hypothetical protein